MRMSLPILAGALLIAASILIVGRYQIDRVAAGAQTVTVLDIDTWTGRPFLRTAPRHPQDLRQYGTLVN
jgi:hypothetical protein